MTPLNFELTLATACFPKVGLQFKVESSNAVCDNHFAKHCNGQSTDLCALQYVKCMCYLKLVRSTLHNLLLKVWGLSW